MVVQPTVHKVFSDVQEKLLCESVFGIFNTMSTLMVCESNKCSDFKSLVEKKEWPEGQTPVHITAHDNLVGQTIRHKYCQLMTESRVRCEVCMTHRGDLMSMAKQDRSKKTNNMTACSTVPNTHLTMRQPHERLFFFRRKRKI